MVKWAITLPPLVVYKEHDPSLFTTSPLKVEMSQPFNLLYGEDRAAYIGLARRVIDGKLGGFSSVFKEFMFHSVEKSYLTLWEKKHPKG